VEVRPKSPARSIHSSAPSLQTEGWERAQAAYQQGYQNGFADGFEVARREMREERQQQEREEWEQPWGRRGTRGGKNRGKGGQGKGHGPGGWQSGGPPPPPPRVLPQTAKAVPMAKAGPAGPASTLAMPPPVPPPAAAASASSQGPALVPTPPDRPPWLAKPKGLDQKAYQIWYTRVRALMQYTPQELLCDPTEVAKWWSSDAAPSDAQIVRGAIGLLEAVCGHPDFVELDAPEAPAAAAPTVAAVEESPPPVARPYVQCQRMCGQCTRTCERDERHKGKHDCEQHADYSDRSE
jgi:hypothetical protein